MPHNIFNHPLTSFLVVSIFFLSLGNSVTASLALSFYNGISIFHKLIWESKKMVHVKVIYDWKYKEYSLFPTSYVEFKNEV